MKGTQKCGSVWVAIPRFMPTEQNRVLFHTQRRLARVDAFLEGIITPKSHHHIHVRTRKRDKADEMPARQAQGMTPGPMRLDIPREIKINNEIKGKSDRKKWIL